MAHVSYSLNSLKAARIIQRSAMGLVKMDARSSDSGSCTGL